MIVIHLFQCNRDGHWIQFVDILYSFGKFESWSNHGVIDISASDMLQVGQLSLGVDEVMPLRVSQLRSNDLSYFLLGFGIIL